MLILFVFTAQSCKDSSLTPEVNDESKQIIEYLKSHGFEDTKSSRLQTNPSNRIATNGSVKTLAEAKKIVEQLEKSFQTDIMLDLKKNTNLKKGRVQMPLCSDGGDYHIQEVAAGFFSSWNIDYSINSGGSFDNVNVYVTGVPIGWSWDQQAVYLHGTTGFCVTGTVTMGVEAGTLPTSLTMMYNLRVTMLSDCKASIRRSFGHC